MDLRGFLTWAAAILIAGALLGLGANEIVRGGGEAATGEKPRTSAEGGGGHISAGAGATASDASRQEVRRATISVSGDILVHQPVWSNALSNVAGERYDFAPMFDAIRPFVAAADLAICHLETPITSGEPSGFPLFSSPPDLVASIRRAGFDGCSTASNHTLDMGISGVERTVTEFRRQGLGQAGSYVSERQSRRPVILEAGDLEIALLSYTDATNGIPSPEPWMVGLLPAADPALEKAREVAADARRAVSAGADAVLVAIHWGDEYAFEPNDSQVELARQVVRIPEVLAIVSHGPHVVQPIRRIGGKPVIYSSGNLLSNQSANAGLPAETQYGLIGLLRLVSSPPGPNPQLATHEGGELEVRERLAGRPGAVETDDRVVTVRRIDYVPTWVRLSDHLVQPVGWGLEHDPANAAALRRAWESTVSIAGRERGVAPLPRHLP